MRELCKNIRELANSLKRGQNHLWSQHQGPTDAGCTFLR
jgi:hypothetical protein